MNTPSPVTSYTCNQLRPAGGKQAGRVGVTGVLVTGENHWQKIKFQMLRSGRAYGPGFRQLLVTHVSNF